MTEYKIKNVKDHILIENDGEMLLIDTGSPVSFHESGLLTLCGESTKVFRSLPEASPQYISQQLGVTVKGLVGMDFIGRHPMSIDVNAGRLVFDCGTEGFSPVPSKSLMGYMKFNMEIDGNPVSIILDTGAPTSYVSSRLTAGKESVGRATDFYPLLGTFTTPIFDIRASLDGHEFPMRVGNLPSLLSLAVGLLANGVFGMDFLKHFKVLVTRDQVYVADFFNA